MSQQTKKYKILAIVFTLLSFLLLAGPLVYYFITGFMIADVSYKFVLSMSLVMCIFLTAISAIAKLNLRCPIFILLLGLYFILDSILPLIIILAAATIVDELLLSPLAKHFRNKYSINKEIDKRLN